MTAQDILITQRTNLLSQLSDNETLLEAVGISFSSGPGPIGEPGVDGEAGPRCHPGADGEPGPPGNTNYLHNLGQFGVPSPHSVTQIQVTQMRWEYLVGSEIMEYVEIWHNGQRLAASTRSIGITGACGPS